MGNSFDDWLSDADALLWTIEKDPILRSTIVVVGELDAVPDEARVRAKVAHAVAAIPRLRQVVQPAPLRLGPPRWVDDPAFSLDFHVRVAKAPTKDLRGHLLDLGARLAEQAFDKARPLWELHLVKPSAKGGRGGFVLKVHHSLTDGVGGVEMGPYLFDLERSPAEPAPADLRAGSPVDRFGLARAALGEEASRNVRRTTRYARSTISLLAQAAVDPVDAVRRAGSTAATAGRLVAPVAEPLSPVMRGRSTNRSLFTHEVPLDDLRRAARAAGGTLNDSFLAAVGGALHRYHRRLGFDVDQLRVTMPVNLRTRGDHAGGNRFTPVRFAVPVAEPDPAERMRQVGSVAHVLAHDPGLAVSDELAAVLSRLPSTVTTEVFGSMLKKVDFVATNVPGSPVRLFLGGAEVEALYPFAPPSGASVAFALLSQVGTCFVGACCDPAAVVDVALLRRCTVEAFDEVVAVGA